MRYCFFILTLLFGFQLMAKTPSEDARKLKKSEDALWYTDRSFINSPSGDSPSEQKKSGNRAKVVDSKTAENIVRFLAYLVGVVVLGALIYAVYSFSINKRQKKQSSQNEQIDTENIETEEQLHKVDFLQKIKDTEDYRLAIRYYYLWLLQDLSKGGLIKFEKNKTNRQYAEELKNHKKAADFNSCTRYYNFVWYGEYPVNSELFKEIVSYFKRLLPHA